MIILKSPEEIEKMRQSNVIVAEIIGEVVQHVKPGVRTIDLDRKAEELAIKRGGRPAFKGYRGYPFSLCISVNEQVVHGMPSERVLGEGDIASLDFGIFYGGYYGDSAVTVPVGNISDNAARLTKATQEALYKGIAMARPGNRLGDISSAIQEHVEANGFSVVRDFVGHGIGKSLREKPTTSELWF